MAAQGREGIKELLKIIASEEDARLPVDAHASLIVLAAELRALQTMIGSIEKRIMARHRSNEASQRLESIPSIGVAGATAIAATVPDPKVFRSGRDFAAWIGIVLREDPTGGKQIGIKTLPDLIAAKQTVSFGSSVLGKHGRAISKWASLVTGSKGGVVCALA